MFLCMDATAAELEPRPLDKRQWALFQKILVEEARAVSHSQSVTHSLTGAMPRSVRQPLLKGDTIDRVCSLDSVLGRGRPTCTQPFHLPQSQGASHPGLATTQCNPSQQAILPPKLLCEPPEENAYWGLLLSEFQRDLVPWQDHWSAATRYEMYTIQAICCFLFDGRQAS